MEKNMKETFTDRDALTQGNRLASGAKSSTSAPYSGGGAATSVGGGAAPSFGGGVAAALGDGAAKTTNSPLDVATRAGDQMMHSAEQHKADGANFVGGFAGAVRRAAREFDADAPQAAQYIRLAADQLDGVADAVRKRDFNRIMADVQSFARQRPVAFFGAAIFAGFAAMRLLKTSAQTGQRVGGTVHRDHTTRHWSPPTAMNMPE
jgi:hypothetical protein